MQAPIRNSWQCKVGKAHKRTLKEEEEVRTRSQVPPYAGAFRIPEALLWSNGKKNDERIWSVIRISVVRYESTASRRKYFRMDLMCGFEPAQVCRFQCQNVSKLI